MDQLEVQDIPATGSWTWEGASEKRNVTRPNDDFLAARQGHPRVKRAAYVACTRGTLSFRFRGTPAEGNVRAKTGTVHGGIALSGYGTTAGGRGFVFSVLVNGARAPAAERPLDALIAAVAAHPG